MRAFVNQRCECYDNLCPVHRGRNGCNRKVTDQLWRVDMDDITGVLFCEHCASDAMNSGLFSCR